MNPLIAMFALSALLSITPVPAQTSIDHDSHHAETNPAATAAPMSDGEVRKVDKSAGKVTIKHGPLRNLDMPAMTMVFRVKDPALLDHLKEGDKIKFAADKIDGALVVTAVKTSN